MSDSSGTSLSASVALHPSGLSRTAARRLRLETRAVLLAVCGLVFVVSLPRLRGIAIQENELDALRALEILASELEASAAPPARIGELFPAGSRLRRRLGDVEGLAGGTLALRHGYLFELRATAAGSPLLVAWPWRHGSTGLASFVALPGRGVYGCGPGREGSGARWSGLGGRPELAPGEQGELPEAARGWRRVRLPGTRTESY